MSHNQVEAACRMMHYIGQGYAKGVAKTLHVAVLWHKPNIFLTPPAEDQMYFEPPAYSTTMPPWQPTYSSYGGGSSYGMPASPWWKSAPGSGFSAGGASYKGKGYQKGSGKGALPGKGSAAQGMPPGSGKGSSSKGYSGYYGQSSSPALYNKPTAPFQPAYGSPWQKPWP